MKGQTETTPINTENNDRMVSKYQNLLDFKNSYKKTYLRGSRVVPAEKFKERYSKVDDIKNLQKRHLFFGDMWIPESLTTSHIMIVGRPGTGKTLGINKMIYSVLRRQPNILDHLPPEGVAEEKMIIYDYKGDFVRRFYRPEYDTIFCPPDERTLQWNIFNDIDECTSLSERTVFIDSICQSLVPDDTGGREQDKFWSDSARQIIRAVITFVADLHLYEKSKYRNNLTIYNIFSGPRENIQRIVQAVDPVAYSYISDINSGQSQGVFGTIARYTKAFEMLSRVDGNFSIKQWVKTSNIKSPYLSKAKTEKEKRDMLFEYLKIKKHKNGNIFITSTSAVRDSLKPALSLFIDLLIKEILSLKDDLSRKIYFFLDEFTSLNKCNLNEAVAIGRSKGMSVILATQSMAQIRDVYGDNISKSLVNSTGTKIIFPVSDFETSRNLSDLLGSEEFKEQTISMSFSEHQGVSTNSSLRLTTSPIILPSEIIYQKALNFIINVAGRYTTKGIVDIEDDLNKHYKQKYAAFSPNKYYDAKKALSVLLQITEPEDASEGDELIITEIDAKTKKPIEVPKTEKEEDMEEPFPDLVMGENQYQAANRKFDNATKGMFDDIIPQIEQISSVENSQELQGEEITSDNVKELNNVDNENDVDNNNLPEVKKK